MVAKASFVGDRMLYTQYHLSFWLVPYKISELQNLICSFLKVTHLSLRVTFRMAKRQIKFIVEYMPVRYGVPKEDEDISYIYYSS